MAVCTFAWPPVLYTDQPNCPLRLYCPLCAFAARCLPLSLPAVCPFGLSIAAAGGCLSLRLCAVYWYALFEGRDGLDVPACLRPYAALNLAASVINCIFCGSLPGGLLGGQCGLLGGLLRLVAGVCHSLLCGLCYGHGCTFILG